MCRAPRLAIINGMYIRTAHPKSSSLIVFFEWSRFRDGERGVYRHVGVQGIEARQGKDDCSVCCYCELGEGEDVQGGH